MGYIPGERSRFCECQYTVVKRGAIFLEGEVDSASVTYTVVKRGAIFWEGGVDSGSVAYTCGKGDIF